MSIQKNKNKKRSSLFVFPLSIVGAFLMMVLWISLLTVFHGDAVQSAFALGGGNGVITHTLVTDFTANCTVTGSGFPTTPVFVNTTTSDSANGEVRLAATLEDYFNGASLNTSLWLQGEVYEWYSSPVVVSGGMLRLDANYVRSQQAFAQPRRFFEARTIVTSGVITAANADQGFYRQNPPLFYTGVTPDTEAIRLFVVANSGANNIYARARNGGSSVNLLDSDISPDPNLTQAHLYRIEWDTTQTRYYIDNVLATTIITNASSLPGYAFLYHQDPTTVYNTGPMMVDWARAGIYPTTGSYVSCVQDALGTVNFSTVAPVTSVPTGSGLTIETRTSNDGIAWSSYQAITGSTINSPSGRYLQYRLSFTSSTQFVSAEVQQLRFNYFGPSAVQISPTNPTVNPGATRQFTVQTVDTNGRAVANLDYTWSIVAGGGTINTTGLFTAGLPSGTFNNTVRVSTPLVGGGSLSSVTSVTVPNLPPTAEAGGPYSGAEATSISFAGTGSDPNGGTVTFAWDLDDNGSYETSGQNVSRTFPDNGTFTVRLRVTKSGGLFTIDTATVNVSNVPPTITGVSGTSPISEGGSSTVTVTATDPAGDNDPLSYSFDCRNDGSYEIGPQASNQAVCVYGDNASYNVRVRVTDGDGGEDIDTSLVIGVINLPPTITSVTGTTPINEGGSTTVTVTATDPAGANDPLLYSFDCQNDGTFDVPPQSSNQAPCTYGDNGTYIVNVRVTDGDGGEDTDATFVVTVNNVAPNISSVTNNGPVAEGSPVEITVIASDVAGPLDPLTYLFDCDNNGNFEVNQSTNKGNCTIYDQGIYTVTVRVEDGDGGFDLDATTVIVANIAPTVSVTSNSPVPNIKPAIITVTATDPAGIKDPLTYEFDCDYNGIYEIGPQFAITAQCNFGTDGTYTVGVRVNDGDGGIVLESTVVEVRWAAKICLPLITK